eukprot:scaffold79445_cov48-Cyclotella_meneghiniana.AAC.3
MVKGLVGGREPHVDLLLDERSQPRAESLDSSGLDGTLDDLIASKICARAQQGAYGVLAIKLDCIGSDKLI